MTFGSFCGSLWRKKTVVSSSLNDTKLKRNLGLVDLIGLGLGSTLGIGVYVVTSYAINNEAGPSYVISVIIAGVASLLAGLCYAELSARLPRAGSAYLYCYVTLGELYGFVVAWNMLSEHIISAAIAAKAWSQYFDFLLNGTISRSIMDKTEWEGGMVIGDYPDLMAFGLLFIVTLLTTTGAKTSTTLSSIFVFFNLLVTMCFICIGYFHVKHGNWTDPPGFFAHGFSGVLSGGATLLFAFANFEVITSASEETREPSKTLPSAVMYSVLISSIVYFCVSTAATLSLHTVPGDVITSLPKAINTLHIHGASSVVAIGGILGLSAAVISICFYLPRLVYAMSLDGILCDIFSKVTEGSHIPTYSVLLTGSISSFIALFVRFELLLEIVSIGTLLAYTTVAICIICLRYQKEHVGLYVEYDDPNDSDFMQCTDFTYANFHLDASLAPTYPLPGRLSKGSGEITNTRLYNGRTATDYSYNNEYLKRSNGDLSYNEDSKLLRDTRARRTTESLVTSTSTGSISKLFQLPVNGRPSEDSWRTASIGLLLFFLSCVIFSVVTLYGNLMVSLESWWILCILFIFAAILIATTTLVAKQPQNMTKLHFSTPYIPFVPLLSILVNIFLMASLPELCWVRFLGWMMLGLLVYFIYGHRYSKEAKSDEQEVILCEFTDEAASSADK